MMRKIATRLAAALCTFLVGVALSAIRVPRSATRHTPSCAEAVRTDDDGRRILSATGMLYGSNEGRLIFNQLECSGDGAAWFRVELDQPFRSDAERRQLVERLNKLSGGDRMARAEVTLVGEVTGPANDDSTGQPVIRVSELRQTGAISLISLVSN